MYFLKKVFFVINYYPQQLCLCMKQLLKITKKIDIPCVTRYLKHEANVPVQSCQDAPTEITKDKSVFVLSYLKSRENNTQASY